MKKDEGSFSKFSPNSEKQVMLRQAKNGEEGARKYTAWVRVFE